MTRRGLRCAKAVDGIIDDATCHGVILFVWRSVEGFAAAIVALSPKGTRALSVFLQPRRTTEERSL